MIHAISNGILEVSASEKGAELMSVRFNGKERLWQGDRRWQGRAPVLFPYCGCTTIVSEGVKYPVLQHGIARRLDFDVIEKTAESITFFASDSAEQRQYYPFAFNLFITYMICGSKLKVIQRVKNTDTRNISFAFGGHESFLLDEPLGSYALEFEKDEKFDSLVYDEGLTGETLHLGCGRRFSLPENVLSNSQTVIFGGINSRRAALVNGKGETVNEFVFEGYPNLLLWRPADANMICFEPWQNLPDSRGAEPVEFSEVPGVTTLKPGEEKAFEREIVYFK